MPEKANETIHDNMYFLICAYHRNNLFAISLNKVKAIVVSHILLYDHSS